MRRQRTVLVAVVVAGALVLGGGAWAVFGPPAGRSPEETVSAFFDARRSGDCERLLDLVSEASWSEDGRLSQAEFLDTCARVVDGYQPELHEVQVRSEDDDRAVVRLEIVAGDERQTDLGAPPERVEGIVVRESGVTSESEGETETLAYEYGRLIRENDEWKVELDQRAFGLGRSAEQTVWDYLEAYRDGDCERMLDHLTEDAWSAGGATDREEFLERCSVAAEARPTPPSNGALPMLAVTPAIAMPQTIEVSRRTDGATAEIPWASGARPDTVRLVVEGLVWKVDTPTLDAFEAAQLGTRFLDRHLGRKPNWMSGAEAIYPDSESDYARPLAEYEGDDVVEQRRRARFERGLAIGIGPWKRSIDLLLYEFADAAGARAYAAHLTDRVVARSTEYDDVTPVGVPGVDGGTAIVTECSGAAFRPRSSGGDCSHANKAAAVAADGRYVVAVEATDFHGPDATAAQMRGQAIRALKAQLSRL